MESMHSHLEVNEFKHELNWTPIDVVLDVFEPACARATQQICLSGRFNMHAWANARGLVHSQSKSAGTEANGATGIALAIIRTRLI